MSSQHKQFRRRLAMLEKSLGKSSQPTETPLYVQVEREAQQELSLEDLPLFESGEMARREGRFHSLEEDAVMKQFQELKDIVARRYGFRSYGGVLCEYIPQTKSGPSAKQGEVIFRNLNWGRDNCAHLHKLREAQEASKSKASASTIALDPASGMASSPPLHYPNL